MSVIKRTPKMRSAELIQSLWEFIYLLESQKEDEAVADLKVAISDLSRFAAGSAEFSGAITLIRESFDGEHELDAYLIRPKSEDWNEAQQLYLAASKVKAMVSAIR